MMSIRNSAFLGGDVMKIAICEDELLFQQSYFDFYK